MELIKKNIHMEHRINWAATQISLEEDQNISDQKPDALRIVCKKAMVKVEESKPVEDAVIVRGILNYEILYLTDEKEKRLCNMDGTIPFEEKIYTNGNVSSEMLRVKAKVEDITIRLINSRKINIRSIIAISITQDELFDEEVVIDAMQPESCEILKKPLDITTISLDTRDIYRIKEEIPIPDGMPNIYNMIWHDLRVDGLSFVPMDGRIGIQGEWKGFFLYEGEEEEIQVRCFEVVRPFSGSIEMPDCQDNMQLCMDYEMDSPNIEIRTDFDGEERLIGIDFEIRLYIKLYQNVIIPVVADAYGITEKLEPVMKNSSCERILKRENNKIKINGSWENKEDPGNAFSIMHVNAEILDQSVQMKEDEAELNGVVHAEILCSTQDVESPYQCISLDIPYQHTTTIAGADSDCPYYNKVCIDQIAANSQGNVIEIRVMISYQMVVYQKILEPLLMDMHRIEEKNVQEMLPVMSVYFAKEKENIWDVGKKYQVPLDSIREVNELSTDELQDGQKLLIVKQMI